MSAARYARQLTRAVLGLSLLAASPLAAQPLEQTTAPAEPAPETAPAEPAEATPAVPAPSSDTTAPAASPAPPAALPAPRSSSRQQIARELFERGREKWSRGEHSEATALLTASNEQAERASTLLLLGESLEKLGRLRSAHDQFESAGKVAQRQHDADAEARARTRAAAILPLIPKMEVRFSVPPPESTLVTLNGVELPREWLNRSMPLDAGEFRLDVRAPGYAPYSAQVVVSNEAAHRGVQVVPVMLTALPAPREPATPAPPLTPIDQGTSSQRQLAWISGGVGAAAAVTGLVLTLMALDKKQDASDECSESEPGAPDPCTPRGVDLRRQATKLANLATASALVGGAGLATSLTLFMVTEQSATPTGAGLRYSGRF